MDATIQAMRRAGDWIVLYEYDTREKRVFKQCVLCCTIRTVYCTYT